MHPSIDRCGLRDSKLNAREAMQERPTPAPSSALGESVCMCAGENKVRARRHEAQQAVGAPGMCVQPQAPDGTWMELGEDQVKTVEKRSI